MFNRIHAIVVLGLVPGRYFAGEGATTQTIAGILKTVYEPVVAEQSNNKFTWNKLFRWEDVDFAGQEVVYNAHVSRNTSPMWVGEDSAFADAEAQGSIKIHVGQRKLMARVRMTSESIADSMKSEGAFKSARKDEMTRIIDDIARMEEYSFTADGRGVLALINEATPSGNTTLILDSPGGITGSDFGNRFIIPKMIIGAVNPATGELRAGTCRVTACAEDGTSVTVDAAPNAAWADNDYIVQLANTSVSDVLDSSYEHAAWGLVALFDDGTYRSNYFNADRSVYPAYKAYVKASTGPISEDLFQQVADITDQRLGGVTDVMTAHHSVRRVYLTMTQADRRYQGNNLMRPDAGTVAFQQGDVPFGGVPIKAIRTHPLAMMFGLDTKNSEFVRYGSEKGKWVDEDEHVLVRVGSGSSGRDAFEAWYRKRYQNHVRKPGLNWRLDGITGQSLVVVREAGS